MTDEMDAFTAPWPTWSAYTDSLYLRTVDEDEFCDGEERPDSKPPPEKKTVDSKASLADTTEISMAPPESETEILTASSTETDIGIYTTSVVPTQPFPPDQIPKIPTSLTSQTIFEGNLYDGKGDIHNEPLYDKDGLMVYTGREKTTLLAWTKDSMASPEETDDGFSTTTGWTAPSNHFTAPPETTTENLTASPKFSRKRMRNLIRHAALFSVDEREDFLTWLYLMDTEQLSSNKFGLELQNLSDEDDIEAFWCKFWKEWDIIGITLEVQYPPEEMEYFTSPWHTWDEWTDDLIREDNEFLANLKAPLEDTTADSEASPKDTTEISTALPANTTEFLTSTPESRTKILTAASIETDDGNFPTAGLAAPPNISTAPPPNTTTPDLIPVKGFLLDNFSEKEANSPPMEEYFPQEIINFQQKIDEVFSEIDEDLALTQSKSSAGAMSETDKKFHNVGGNFYEGDGETILDGEYNFHEGQYYDGEENQNFPEKIGVYDDNFPDDKSEIYDDGDEEETQLEMKDHQSDKDSIFDGVTEGREILRR